VRDDLRLLAAAALPLALFVSVERAVAGVSGFPLDDSWIHLHFARNLAEGHGFAYNPDRPIAGSTAPLWTLVLAAGALVVGPSVTLAKVLSMAGAVGAAILTRRAALAWGAAPGTALLTGVALLWTGPMAWGALSGMEVTLAALLVAGALLALAHDRTAWTAALASLAILARPEAALLVPFLALAGPRRGGRLAAFVLVPAVLLAPAVAFAWVTAGGPFPASATAKIEGGLVGWLSGLHEPLTRTFVDRPWAFTREWLGWLLRTHPLLPLAVLPALPLTWRSRRRLGIVGLILLAHPLGMALIAPYRGPGFQEGRYSIHLLPLALVVLAVGLGPVVERRRRAALVLWLALALWTLVPAAQRYAWSVQNIDAMQVRIGRWADANLPRRARLAVNDIGAIAYLSRREIVDLMGLVTPEILPYRRQGEEGIIRFIGEVCPDYVIVFPSWFPRLTARADLLEPVHQVALPRVEVAGGPEMVVYRLRRCAV
jgi:arabinofuranosyltransferase